MPTSFSNLPISEVDRLNSYGRLAIIHDFTTAGSGATGTATGSGFRFLEPYSDVEIIIDVTSTAGAATNTLKVFVDTELAASAASGTWRNIGVFPALVSPGQTVMHITRRQPSGIEVATSDAGFGTLRAIGHGTSLRVRREVTGTATTKFSATIYISALL